MKQNIVWRSRFFCSEVKFASIDIGNKNFAIVWGHCDVDYTTFSFDSFTLINFNKVEAKEKSGPQQYTHLMDKLKTYFEIENKGIFDGVDMILVEYQPPQGMRLIQEYLVVTFKQKVFFVHPRKMHKFFNASCYEYERRKKFINYKAIEFMTFEFYEKWDDLERKHDVSDAICLAFCYIYVNSRPIRRIGKKRKFKRKKKRGKK